MKITGLHFLLTYQCIYECDHCFVWGSPRQTGVMTIEQIRTSLRQARDLKSVDWIYFEGGEPFLYYPLLMRGVQLATSMGFHVGIVTNAYWATSRNDALIWLKPFVDMVEDLSISCDQYHDCDEENPLARNALAAAEQLGIPVGLIKIAQPESLSTGNSEGQLPAGDSGVMFRGRAACKLADKVKQQSWTKFDACLHEDLREPGRVHLDPFGNIHVCQGVVIGNITKKPLKMICDEYKPETHPVVAPILSKGPVGLVKQYDLPHKKTYADACQLCYEARTALRDRFPEILAPENMYGAY
jgi:MoaA/NifB/PqqE/SkfB family radical SAM enzyme